MSTIRAIDALLVCTGNICRSPMAEGLLGQRLAGRGVDATVHSAGLVTENQPASDHGVDAMARRGIDISGHRSRRLDAGMVAGADLVVGMERQHVREAAVLAPGTPGAYTVRHGQRISFDTHRPLRAHR